MSATKGLDLHPHVHVRFADDTGGNFASEWCNANGRVRDPKLVHEQISIAMMQTYGVKDMCTTPVTNTDGKCEPRQWPTCSRHPETTSHSCIVPILVRLVLGGVSTYAWKLSARLHS